ncbi:MAG: hypothetical protein ABI557_01965 [Aureliella sp.]
MTISQSSDKIKAIWGSGWDGLFVADKDGRLASRMNEAVDGDFQNYATESGQYIREHFFATSPQLQAMVTVPAPS